MTEFKALARDRSVSVRIAEQIAARIEGGEFPVGTKLPAETDLARQFGVSRPSVREALGALQFVGYVESVRGSGSRVISRERSIAHGPLSFMSATPQDVLRLFEARLIVEPQVAAMAAREPRWQKLEEVEGLIDGMDVVVSNSTLHGETDLGVHRALAEVCRNSFLTASVRQLLDAAESPHLRATRNQAWSNRELPVIWSGQQRAIVEAIRARDVAAAVETTWRHLESSARNAISMIKQDPSAKKSVIQRFEAFLEEGPYWNVQNSRQA